MFAEELSEHQINLRLILDNISYMRRNLRTMALAEVIDMCIYYTRKLVYYRDRILKLGGTVEDPRYDYMLQWTQDILDTRDMRETVLKNQRIQLRF